MDLLGSVPLSAPHRPRCRHCDPSRVIYRVRADREQEPVRLAETAPLTVTFEYPDLLPLRLRTTVPSRYYGSRTAQSPFPDPIASVCLLASSSNRSESNVQGSAALGWEQTEAGGCETDESRAPVASRKVLGVLHYSSGTHPFAELPWRFFLLQFVSASSSSSSAASLPSFSSAELSLLIRCRISCSR